jgi:hypothetical protein
MSDSLGPIVELPSLSLRNGSSGVRYEMTPGKEGQARFGAIRPDGGARDQRVIGRIGAGIFDVSFIGVEVDPAGRSTERLSFLPLEWVSGHGPALSPFELVEPGAGLDMPVNAECLRCHTLTEVSNLPGASGSRANEHIWPSNRLGADAWTHIQPLSCSACHGDTSAHERLMALEDPPESGLVRLSSLPPAAQRDICAQCHLQGEGEVALAPLPRGGPQPEDFSARRPVLVPTEPGADFRFVGQTHRLSLSRCFRSSPQMTCTTCHSPHRSSRFEDFNAACLRCHARQDCSRSSSLRIEEVSHAPARTQEGCIDCHVRRSQPFDLPHVQTADHFIRARIEPPSEPPYRASEQPSGALTVFDDGRLAGILESEAGKLWTAGLVALAYQRMGRIDEAASLLSRFPSPGSERARTPSSPPPLPALETHPDFHHIRGLVLEAQGESQRAMAAYSDALQLDPAHPQARLNRGSLLLKSGDVSGALEDAGALVELYPHAEKPWNLRALAALQANDRRGAMAALEASTARWPSDAAIWRLLAQVLESLHEQQGAEEALRRARLLEPSR